LSEDKSGKHRWTDPVILVPIITAIIAAIPTYVLLIRPAIKDTQSPIPESTPSPLPERTPSAASITVGTDKGSYTIDEIVTISGNVSKPESGKSLRIDVYDPIGKILAVANAVKIYPNGRGLYTYDLYTDSLNMGDGEFIPGEYKVRVSYLNQNVTDTFDIE
jgi:hypothetical protein